MDLDLANRFGVLVQHLQRVFATRAATKALHHLAIDAQAQHGSGYLVVLSDHRLFRCQLTIITAAGCGYGWLVARGEQVRCWHHLGALGCQQ